MSRCAGSSGHVNCRGSTTPIWHVAGLVSNPSNTSCRWYGNSPKPAVAATAAVAPQAEAAAAAAASVPAGNRASKDVPAERPATKAAAAKNRASTGQFMVGSKRRRPEPDDEVAEGHSAGPDHTEHSAPAAAARTHPGNPSKRSRYARHWSLHTLL